MNMQACNDGLFCTLNDEVLFQYFETGQGYYYLVPFTDLAKGSFAIQHRSCQEMM